jgi:nucleoside-diphosphate-sugar epimerase
MKKTIAVIGAKGFVGTSLSNYIHEFTDYNFIPVVRGDNVEAAVEKSDIIIYSANSGRRFFANNNPEKDFMDSVEKTAHIFEKSHNKRFVLVSSISARTQLNTAYGRNRRACELIVSSPNSLVVRLGPMYGGGKSVGALADIQNNKTVYVAPTTKYAFVDVDYNAKQIVSLAEDTSATGIVELGAKEGISLSTVKELLGSSSNFEGDDDTQVPLSPASDAPSLKDIEAYLHSLV